MSGCSVTVDRRFPVQQISETKWMRATAANAAADYARGFRDEVTGFLRPRPSWQSFYESLRNSSATELADFAAARRTESLGFIVLMLTGVCNADCPICFTDRRRKPNELTPADRSELLAQAAGLGAQYVYVPGEGEPTLDKGWWQFLEDCAELDLPAIVFTNGMIFGDADLCRRTWDMDPIDAAKRLNEYPVNLYVKYWTPDAELAARFLDVPERRLPYGSVAGLPVPLGLQVLMENVKREQLGVEVVIERRNADVVVDTIAPFTDEQGLARIIEIIQHNGRTFGDPSFDPTAQQVEAVAPLLSPTSCTQATCKAVVTVQGYLSPRIAVLEHQLPEERAHVAGADLYELLHTTPYIVQRRYNLSCLCESIPAELAESGDTLIGTYNVTPPELSEAVAAEAPAEPTARSGHTGHTHQTDQNEQTDQTALPHGCTGTCTTCQALCSKH